MNKLTALSKLANAYYYLSSTDASNEGALNMLCEKFHYVRRSLNLVDLAPKVCNEGYNGRMPTQL